MSEVLAIEYTAAFVPIDRPISMALEGKKSEETNRASILSHPRILVRK